MQTKKKKKVKDIPRKLMFITVSFQIISNVISNPSNICICDAYVFYTVNRVSSQM